jgi:VanZ family protein
VIFLLSTERFESEATFSLFASWIREVFPAASLATLRVMHGVARKAGHVLEYFILSLLVLRGFRGEGSGWRLLWGVGAVALSAAYAGLDELHQALVPARGPSPWDVLLDCSGAAAAQVLAWWRNRDAETRPNREANHD